MSLKYAKKEIERLKKAQFEHAKKENTDLTIEEFEKEYEYDNMVNDAALELLEVFINQGHSGFSASVTLNRFKRLANHEPLAPLTGNDDEWSEMRSWNNDKSFNQQNKRLSSVFKKYDADKKFIGYSYNDIICVLNDSEVWRTYPPIDEPSTLDDDNDKVRLYFDTKRAVRDKHNSEIEFPFTKLKTHKYKWNFETKELEKVGE